MRGGEKPLNSTSILKAGWRGVACGLSTGVGREGVQEGFLPQAAGKRGPLFAEMGDRRGAAFLNSRRVNEDVQEADGETSLGSWGLGY